MTQEKELQPVRYGFWGYLFLIAGLAGITAFLLFINQDALLNYGLTYRQIWSVWGGVFGFLFLGTICSPFYWRWKQRKQQLIYLPPDPLGAENKTIPDVITTLRDYTDLKQLLNLRYRTECGDAHSIQPLRTCWLRGEHLILRPSFCVSTTGL
ncbi:MAG: hypothetical protein E6556_13125 [Pantoea sp.]|nr:hypothetical protein [Pantoea sp.]